MMIILTLAVGLFHITWANQFAYVASIGDRTTKIVPGTISIIDVDERKVIGNPIKVGTGPFNFAIPPDGKFAFFTDAYSEFNTYYNRSKSNISILDTATQKVVNSIYIQQPVSIAATPDSKLLLVARLDGTNCALETIDIATQKIIGEPVIFPSGLSDIAITPDSKFALITNYKQSTVVIMDINTRKVIGKPIQVRREPYRIAITPNGKLALVILGTHSVAIIDIEAQKVIGEPIFIKGNPRKLAITPDGQMAYLCNWDGTISIIEIPAHKLIDTSIKLQGAPAGITITQDGRLVLVSSRGRFPPSQGNLSKEPAGLVYIIDVKSQQIIGNPILVGPEPMDIAIMPTRNNDEKSNVNIDKIDVKPEDFEVWTRTLIKAVQKNNNAVVGFLLSKDVQFHWFKDSRSLQVIEVAGVISTNEDIREMLKKAKMEVQHK